MIAYVLKYPKILTPFSLLDEYLIKLLCYHCIIHLHISFTALCMGICIWNPRKFKNLQKRVIRIISAVSPRFHTDPLFSKMKILKFNNPYRCYVALFMYKLTLGKLPNIFPMFVLNSRLHVYGTTQAHHYHLPLCQTNLIKMPLTFEGPQIWIELASNIDVDCAVSTFKNRLKMFIATNMD